MRVNRTKRGGWMARGGRVCAAAAGIGWVAACGGNDPPPKAAEVERTAFLGQRCPGLELGAGPLDPAKARVFVEVAEVSTRDLPRPIGRWLDENAVKVRSTANLVAFPNVPTSMPWGQCVDAVCSSMKLSITLTAQLPERGSEPVALALRIDEAAPEGSDAPRRVLLDTTLQALHEEPVVLPPAPEISAGSVVVTPYVLERHDDLQRIMSCRAR